MQVHHASQVCIHLRQGISCGKDRRESAVGCAEGVCQLQSHVAYEFHLLMGLRFILTGFAWLLITSESLWNWGFITGIEWELWDQRVIDQGPMITNLGCPIKGPE
jgi:hypothetical protein